MNKETLEINKTALELLLGKNHDKATDYKAQISVIEQELEGLGKPKVTPEFLDKLNEAITEAVENIDLDDGITCDYEIDYDNRVTMSDIRFEDTHGVTEKIYSEVAQLFAEVIEKEEKQPVCAPGSIEKFN